MIRPSFLVIQFPKGRYLLQQEQSSYHIIPIICPSFVNHWQTLQQNYRTCYKQMHCSHTSKILDVAFHWIFAAYFWLQNFNKKLLKERNLVVILWKNNFLKRNVWLLEVKRIFICDGLTDVYKLRKTFCHLGRLGTWNLIDVFSNVFTE